MIRQNNQTLATKYRPNTWDDVVGQDTTIAILKHQIETKTTAGAYLFCGHSGTGKTTCARIFADYLNDHKGYPCELDAASNNSVENVRQIIEQSKQRSLDSEYKIHIIDECHSLSSQGWQAFLKLIEEPPKFTKFIFCTTNPEKIPMTIKTRVQEFVFLSVPRDLIETRLKDILKLEGIDCNSNQTRDAVWEIANRSKGSMRQAISNLEKCLSLSKELTPQTVCDALGIDGQEQMCEFMIALIEYNSAKALQIVDSVVKQGRSLALFIEELWEYVVELNKIDICDMEYRAANISYDENMIRILAYRESFSWLMENISSLYFQIKNGYAVRPITELSIMKWCKK